MYLAYYALSTCITLFFLDYLLLYYQIFAPASNLHTESVQICAYLSIMLISSSFLGPKWWQIMDQMGFLPNTIINTKYYNYVQP